MLKKEWIYREILYQVLEKKNNFIKQNYLSKRCGVSIGNVHKSIRPLENMNAIEKKPQGFLVINPKKILLFWASMRNLRKDVIYETRIEKPVEEIEKNLPSVLFTAYSGYKFIFDSTPSDYSEVLVYGNIKEIKERFPIRRGKPNLVVLKTDSHLKKFKAVPLGQLFVDLWNLNMWYAEEFLRALEKKIFGE